ncbi:Fic family protein [Seleniivibrio woodruffii]|uniref:Fic family protein n=1 Tax=Seleniivibrio woodruffii TaxID=1078050 RepID=UPI0026F0F88F|nr:Fic family protein [Seleniivibrio woodruffii]
MIRKVITDNYENVHFSDKYDSATVAVLVRELDVRASHFTKLPIVSDVREFLTGELVTASVFSTALIGRPELEEYDVRAFIKNEPNRLDEKQIRFVNNIKRAFEYVDRNHKTFEMNTEELRKLHMMFTLDTENALPGVFRDRKRQEGNRDYTPPAASLNQLTEDFCVWFASEDMKKQHPAIRAFLAHYHIGMLQPFTSGNGRTARAVEAMLLKQSGHRYLHHALSQYYRRNRKDYIKAFIQNEKTGGFDMTPFLVFCLDGAARAYRLLTDMAVSGLRAIGLKDHIRALRAQKKITDRQKELLDILFVYEKPFTFADLLTNPMFSGLYKGYTENTARNDIKRLKELNIINSADGREFTFNRFVLG